MFVELTLHAYFLNQVIGQGYYSNIGLGQRSTVPSLDREPPYEFHSFLAGFPKLDLNRESHEEVFGLLVFQLVNDGGCGVWYGLFDELD